MKKYILKSEKKKDIEKRKNMNDLESVFGPSNVIHVGESIIILANNLVIKRDMSKLIKNGYEIKTLDFIQEISDFHYNPLLYLSTYDEISSFWRNVLAFSNIDKEPFWFQSILLALANMTKHFSEEGNPSIHQIMKLACKYESDCLVRRLEKVESDEIIFGQASNQFPQEVKLSIITSVISLLRYFVLGEDFATKITEDDTIDLKTLRDRKEVIYIIKYKDSFQLIETALLYQIKMLEK